MYLKIVVVPRSRKECIELRKNGSWRVCVKEPAHDNRANRRTRELIAEKYGVGVSQVRIMTGHQRQSKMVSIRNS